MIKTESYVLGREEIVEVGKEYYWGQLWYGNGDGEEILDSGYIAMYDNGKEEYIVVYFEIIDLDKEDIMKSIVRVTDI